MAKSLMDRYNSLGLNTKPYKRIILSHKRPENSRQLVTVNTKILNEGLPHEPKSVDRELVKVAPEEATEWACAEDPDCACCWCEYYKWVD
jgi:hypothetical protein